MGGGGLGLVVVCFQGKDGCILTRINLNLGGKVLNGYGSYGVI